jgi:hypothetical protein
MALEGGEGSAYRPGHFLPPGKVPVPILQEAGWAPGPVWKGAENLTPSGIRSSDRPARSQSLYRLSYPAHPYYTSQQDFVPRKVYCVSNVTFHTESKYAIKIFPSPTVFVQWNFLLLIFRNFIYFLQWFFSTWTNILNCFEHRVVTYSLPLSNH